MPTEDIRPYQNFDESDLALNGQTYECPECGGTGIVQTTDPDFNEWEEECDQCSGSGLLGIIRYTPEPKKK